LGEKRTTVLCLLLALLTLALYNPVVHHRFTNLDDYRYITRNVHVQAGLNRDTVKWAFTTFDEANWHPLTWLSHALDFQLFGLNPAGHHYESVLLHALNVALLFLLLARATGRTWPSLMVAVLFALHPVNVESVAWAAERKNVLSMLFFLLALHAYGWYGRQSSVRRYALLSYALVFGLFALGLMAKPEIITLPFVLLLWDYWPLRRMSGVRASVDEVTLPVPRSFLHLFAEKIPLLLLSAGSAVVTYLAQRHGQTLRALSLPWRYGNAAVAYMRYLGMAFWPAKLAALYPHPGHSLPVWKILASTAALLLLTGIFIAGRQRRYLLVGWLWFLGTLVPVIGIVQVGVQAMADRYAYLPYIGLFICVIWGVADAARDYRISDRKIPAGWLAVPAVFVLVPLAVASRRQIGYWQDSETLWRHTLSVTGDRNYIAHDCLAKDLAAQGRADEAIGEFKKAESQSAYSPQVMMEIGAYEQDHGHPRDAIEEYARLLEAAPDGNSRAEALSLLGSAYTQAGDFPQAESSYAAALRENPNDPPALMGSGLLAERDRDYGDGAARISRAIALAPTDVGYLLLAQALQKAGRIAEAEAAVEQARRISQDLAQARRRAAQVMSSVGMAPE
jgi:tetratricopeptide (TPR) repeat protein